MVEGSSGIEGDLWREVEEERTKKKRKEERKKRA